MDINNDQKGIRTFELQLSKSIDRKLIKHLDNQKDVQEYLKLLVRKDASDVKITKNNWLRHLDLLTDKEISEWLDITEGKQLMDEQRAARPDISDRTHAEFLRDF